MITAATSAATEEWLLCGSDPVGRWLALTVLQHRPGGDAEVAAARQSIPSSPWAKRVMEGLHPEGWWEDPQNLGHPKLTGTMFRLEGLADLGVPLRAQIEVACDRLLRVAEYPGEGFATARYRGRRPHECSNARLLFTLSHFGYGDDHRVKAAVAWLLANQMLDGGWNCNHEPKARLRDGAIQMDHVCALGLPHHRSSLFTTMAVLKGLASLREPPTEAIARGVEFILEHRVHRARHSNRAIYRWPPRLYFPPQLHYDGLQPLRVLMMCGAAADPRMDGALDYLEGRAVDGRWHSDGAPVPPSRDPRRTLTLDAGGEPNAWVTAHALAVLRRFGRVEAAATVEGVERALGW